jgi:hypothetical protein
VFLVFAWALTHTLLAVWAERWFALPAAVCFASFLVAAGFQGLVLPLMALDNLVFTIVIVRVWFPRQDIARIQEVRRDMERRARRWIGEARERRRPQEEE